MRIRLVWMLFLGAMAFSWEGWSAEPARKAAQAYSVYREEEGLPPQFDNHDDAAQYDSLSALTLQLMRSAARMSKYRLPDAQPAVTRMRRDELEKRGCPEAMPHCQVAALYLPVQGVLIAEDLKPETNLFHRSILFHEIVHYLQEVNRELATSAPCDRWFQREVEAYSLQNRFLNSVYSPERVSYSGARPSCESDSHAHLGKDVKAPDAPND